MGKTTMCRECREFYARCSNLAFGPLGDSWAEVWRKHHEACGCVGENIHFDGMRIKPGGK